MRTAILLKVFEHLATVACGIALCILKNNVPGVDAAVVVACVVGGLLFCCWLAAGSDVRSELMKTNLLFGRLGISGKLDNPLTGICSPVLAALLGGAHGDDVCDDTNIGPNGASQQQPFLCRITCDVVNNSMAPSFAKMLLRELRKDLVFLGDG